MTVSEIALAHQADVIRRSEMAVQASLRIWRQADMADLDASWTALSPQIVAAGSAAQVRNAAASVAVTAKLGAIYGEPAPVALITSSYSGIDGSGRSMEGLLSGTVTTTKKAIGAGLGTREAFLTGASYMAAMMKTSIADMARASDSVASAGKGWTRYVRVVNAGACSRCAVLAGASSFSVAFQRHPACRCTTCAISSDGNSFSNDLPSSPEEYFGTLSAGEQDRIFTKSGAEAIRLGGNPIKVVNARRGALVSSSRAVTPGQIQRSSLRRTIIGSDGRRPIYGYETLEGVSVRGSWGRQQGSLGTTLTKRGRYTAADRQRVMPETIFQLTDDVETRKLLLRDAGFLDQPFTASDFTDNSWIQRQQQARVADRAAADAFLNSIGVRLS
jgi:hypothetical protein